MHHCIAWGDNRVEVVHVIMRGAEILAVGSVLTWQYAGPSNLLNALVLIIT